MVIQTANGGGTSGVSGKIILSSGVTTKGDSGALYIGSGNAGTGRGGSVYVTVGTGDTGSGGELVLLSGSSTASSGTGGNIILKSGSSTTFGNIKLDIGGTSDTAGGGDFGIYGSSTTPFMKISNQAMYIGGTATGAIRSSTINMYASSTLALYATSVLTLNANAISLIAGGGANNVISMSGGVAVTGGMSIYTGGLWISGGLTVTGLGIYASLGITTSDSRLKTDIEPLPNPLSKVSKLRGVYFSWVKDEPSGMKFDDRRHVGVLAQDVREVLPEIVDEIQGGKYLGVDYPALIPLLIEAIRELDDRTMKLKVNLEAVESLVTQRFESKF